MRLTFAIMYVVALAFFITRQPLVKEEPVKEWQTPKVLAGGVSPLAFADSYASEKQIGDDIIKLLKIKGQVWDQNDFISVVKTLQFGNNHPDYRIDYRLVLAYFAHESDMAKFARRTNVDGTTDYGIGQHNSCCIRQRWVSAYLVVKKNKITALPGDSPYDMTAQTLSTIEFLRENRQTLDAYGKANGIRYGIRDWILVYNLGFQGFRYNSKGEEFNKKYYEAVMNGVRVLDNSGFYTSVVDKFGGVM